MASEVKAGVYLTDGCDLFLVLTAGEGNVVLENAKTDALSEVPPKLVYEWVQQYGVVAEASGDG